MIHSLNCTRSPSHIFPTGVPVYQNPDLDTVVIVKVKVNEIIERMKKRLKDIGFESAAQLIVVIKKH